MSLFSKIYRSAFIPAISASSAALLLSACAPMLENERTLSEAESCKRLQGLIANHADNFRKYKMTLRKVRNMNSWSTEQVFPSAQNCAIWEWSNGLHTYICDWLAEDGQHSARADYNEGQRIIENCLGNAWLADSQVTKSGGESTLYENPDIKTTVSLRYFQEPRSWFEKWRTVIAIGDKNNLKAKLR